MILADLNQTPIILQIFALNPDGSEKKDVTSGTVRVYSVLAGGETNLLAPTALARIGTTNVWRYEWVPAALPVGSYMMEFAVNDASLTTKVGNWLVVRDIAAQATLTAVQSTLSLVQADASIIRKVETGRWKIEANQMIFYDDDQVTPILTFDLFDDAHLPSEDRVFERDPV